MNNMCFASEAHNPSSHYTISTDTTTHHTQGRGAVAGVTIYSVLHDAPPLPPPPTCTHIHTVLANTVTLR